ncbi:3D domain-containing protein [Gramella sp. MAR_2010_147]|uniref:3D domain-containing protein n=1 Tax=Gramella sp. MAR_2010_147 TaxID=1250205 RepID=UPI00087D3A3D|nr:3D domain-containing protein [Gramella sp. MAR_2010_147]SDR80576.1 3D (Asp-Asp-Asp) domain-containing protein [Gramella sp. MAR_2010_147]
MKCLKKYFLSFCKLFHVPGILGILLIIISSCNKLDSEEDALDWNTICVTATAYNSLEYQTEGHPSITAWGDTLKPGMKAIAVSRDLLKLGLDHNSKIKIEGFDGVFLVKDKMHYRWRNRIDIYMGKDVNKAKKFGRKKINISYVFQKDEAVKE